MSKKFFSRFAGIFKSSGDIPSSYHYYLQTPGKPVWTPREFRKFADEAYIRNVIAFRSIAKIAQGAASVDWKIKGTAKGDKHPLIRLLKRPNPCCGGAEFFETIYSYKLIGGNSYILGIGPESERPRELHALRPDRVSVIAGKSGMPIGYRYQVGNDNKYKDYRVDSITGRSEVLHLKFFHPLNDWYGLSPIEAAAYSIDQHNQAGSWNQALLQNGARPSGALVVKMASEGGPGTLSDEQYNRIKRQIDEEFAGPDNAGRPILLEGGLDWREMSLSPKDMDFIETKNSAARDIALAFGVPPQLLGIPGDNTYSNLVEARLALWEQTILPFLDNITDALNNWLVPQFGGNIELAYDLDSIPALAPRREAAWNRVKDAGFLSDEEKRRVLGVDNI